jgi:hypothetical protein
MIDFPSESTFDNSNVAVYRFHRAMQLLLDAREYATRTASSFWEFAVEIELLRQLGLSQNDLRFLVRSRQLEHATEITIAGQGTRSFRPNDSMVFDEHSCFVLTSLGASSAGAALKKLNSLDVVTAPYSIIFPTMAEVAPQRKPSWDADLRILRLDGQIVKNFRRRAINQELVLIAFQEEAWPTRIDDPLAPQPCLDMKRRLNDTIKCLNRGHVHHLLHFRGDGTGEGVIWEVVE